jgi:hypothetical protein
LYTLALLELSGNWQIRGKWYHGHHFEARQQQLVTEASGILVANVKPGRNVFAIAIKSLARELRPQDVGIGQDVEARPFWIDGEVCK